MLEEKLLEIMRADLLSIHADTAYRTPDTLTNYIRRVETVLRALAQVHPLFTKLAVFVSLSDEYRELRDLSEIEALVRAAVVSDAPVNPDQPDDLVNTAADRSLLPETRSRLGFNVM